MPRPTSSSAWLTTSTRARAATPARPRRTGEARQALPPPGERYRNDPSHTERDFQALADAYYNALDELHHMDRHVWDDLRDVEAHMHTLMDYYGGRGYWDGRHRR